MKKRVFIIHGWEGSPDEPMHKWLKKELEENGLEVHVPAMPDPETPRIPDWLDKISEVVGEPDENTYLVWHSIGCQAVLRYLEALPTETRIGGAVLIAPWMELDKQTLTEERPEVVDIARPWMETLIDFEMVHSHTPKFVTIFSDNDPYVSLNQSGLFKEKLGARIIVEHNMGHFDPDSGVEAVPSVRDAILEMANS